MFADFCNNRLIKSWRKFRFFEDFFREGICFELFRPFQRQNCRKRDKPIEKCDRAKVNIVSMES